MFLWPSARSANEDTKDKRLVTVVNVQYHKPGSTSASQWTVATIHYTTHYFCQEFTANQKFGVSKI